MYVYPGRETDNSETDAEILDLVQEDELELEIEQADVFAERIQRAIIDANNAIDVRKMPATLLTVSEMRTSGTLHSSPPLPIISTHSTKVKLPKLPLKNLMGIRLSAPPFGIVSSHLYMEIQSYLMLISSIILTRF